jgi:membrane protein
MFTVELAQRGSFGRGLPFVCDGDQNFRMAQTKNVWGMVKQSFSEWNDDKCARLGAALSYYTIFSLAPLLLIVISLAGLFFGKEAAAGAIYGQISGLVGSDAAKFIQEAVAKANHTGSGVVGLLVGIVVLLVGATGVVVELQDALNTVWKVVAKPNRGVWGFVRTRLISIAMIMSLGFLLLVSLIFSAALSAVTGWLRQHVGNIALVGWAVDFVVSLGTISLLIALIYKILPEAHVAWRDVWVGAPVTAALFILGKYLIGLYIGKASVGSAFGAAGSLAVLLVWIYYSTQLILLGAEFTRVYANRFGRKVVPTAQSEPAAQAVKDRPPPYPDASPTRA